MKEKLILIRYAAYGDHLFMSAVLPYLFEKYHVFFETNLKGALLFTHDDRFEKIVQYEPARIPDDKRVEVVFAHWKKISEDNPGTKILNFFQAMEDSCIVNEIVPDALLSQEERAKKFGHNFYENHFKMAEIDFPKDFVPPQSIVYKDYEIKWAEEWRKRNDGQFVMLVPIAGSSIQKVFPTWLESFLCSLIDELPKLKIYLMGDMQCENEDWEYTRTVSLVPRKRKKVPSFRQSLIMAKYADYVFGSETGLLVGAGMWGTPKTALMTSAHKDQFAKYQLNDYSEQSTAPCSPCYRTCYSGNLCQKEMFYGVFPKCTVAWDFEKLKDNIRKEYKKRGY